MATKFYDAQGVKSKETSFTAYLNGNCQLETALSQPSQWENVQFLFTDGHGQDIFKVSERSTCL